MKGKCLLIDTIHPVFCETLKASGIVCVPGFELSKEEVLNCISEYTGIAIRSRFKIDSDFISRSGNLKFIARAGAGMENIDLDAADTANIACINAPEGNRDAVGEHAIGMLLSIMNNLQRADQEVRSGVWKREENRGYELQGKTIGIIGFGNMGSAFAKKLRGFEMNILTYDKYIKIDADKYPYVKQVEMAELFDKSDIISLHLPLTNETMFMADESFFNNLKKQVWFINTARGKVVKTEALVNALKKGKVIGAALDVLEYESISFENLDATKLPEPFQYLIQSDRVILSPHIAGWTHESNEKIAKILAEKIIIHLELS
jgi:D-3-phosphoglycerate dehydrogenase / 2-oxoglutarate reductase